MQGSARLWTHVFAAYWVAIVCYYILYKNYKTMSDMRAKFLGASGSRATVRQYAVLVTDIPASRTVDRHSQVDAFFQKLHPGTFEQAQVITKLSKVRPSFGQTAVPRRSFGYASCLIMISLDQIFCPTFQQRLCPEQRCDCSSTHRFPFTCNCKLEKFLQVSTSVCPNMC